jgi:hypothetical protein
VCAILENNFKCLSYLPTTNLLTDNPQVADEAQTSLVNHLSLLFDYSSAITSTSTSLTHPEDIAVVIVPL